MILNTENLSTLKIHKLTQAQYDRELAADRIDENALYLTPEEEIDLSAYATIEQMNGKAPSIHSHTASEVGAYTKSEVDAKISSIPTPDVSGQINTHNTSGTAHSDIRTAVSNAASAASIAQSTANAAQTAANNAQTIANSKAPMYQYSTTDLIEGSSALTTGTLYFVYE